MAAREGRAALPWPRRHFREGRGAIGRRTSGVRQKHWVVIAFFPDVAGSFCRRLGSRSHAGSKDGVPSGSLRPQSALCRCSGFPRCEKFLPQDQAVAHAALPVHQTGRWIVAGGAAVGLGALCYYGLGMSNEIGALEKAVIWPQYVKDRIRSTYTYFAGSVGLTALSAVAAIGATFAVMIGAGMLVRSIDYEQSPIPKHVAWMLHAGVMGAVVAPLTLLGGPLLIRAAWYTAGIVGGLSAVAMCAPRSMFLPPTSILGAGMYSIAIYGGLVLFSLFLLHDTQQVIKRAESQPYLVVGMRKYDPINACMGIYMDTLNIFIRVATMLAGGGGRKK
ncbi:hypothetical protein Chor_013719 [Crotalus horridus]